ncbi:uncharacterized protein BJ171DRAFT_505973 [Polychytrium aggregatum]|uniref:uncharacterized protein n=1 Tax=Polychytrium aggregatum TaxID=110093 RepID=UPI0022FE0E40|nr:uncharacterized protein BJ171DRAFT_505973 [Polychytrium aggregatum]KAI9204507.1 hypothetical protein BJ171DRAFT_505973 [Polychytrium aggregatum]
MPAIFSHRITQLHEAAMVLLMVAMTLLSLIAFMRLSQQLPRSHWQTNQRLLLRTLPTTPWVPYNLFSNQCSVIIPSTFESPGTVVNSNQDCFFTLSMLDASLPPSDPDANGQYRVSELLIPLLRILGVLDASGSLTGAYGGRIGLSVDLVVRALINETLHPSLDPARDDPVIGWIELLGTSSTSNSSGPLLTNQTWILVDVLDRMRRLADLYERNTAHRQSLPRISEQLLLRNG